MPTDGPHLEFRDLEAWEEWLGDNHTTAGDAWLRIAKKGAPYTTVRYPEVLDAAICFGWIDGLRRSLDEHFFLQRFVRRRPKSKWSQINREKVERLIAERRMRPAGLAEVQAAKADGRWAAAYEPQSRATVPEDFQRELDAHPEANAFFQTLRGQNRYAFLYRLQDVKTPARRAERIATFIDMLRAERTFY